MINSYESNQVSVVSKNLLISLKSNYSSSQIYLENMMTICRIIMYRLRNILYQFSGLRNLTILYLPLIYLFIYSFFFSLILVFLLYIYLNSPAGRRLQIFRYFQLQKNCVQLSDNVEGEKGLRLR